MYKVAKPQRGAAGATFTDWQKKGADEYEYELGRWSCVILTRYGVLYLYIKEKQSDAQPKAVK